MDETIGNVGSMWLSQDLKPFKQGAEAYLFRCTYLGRKAVVKERFVKTYRHPSLDLILTKGRMKAELIALHKCKMIGIDVPTVYFVNSDRNCFVMEEIFSGITARQFIEDSKNKSNFEEIIVDFGIRIGQIIAKLHFGGLTHGDLTTSNILLRSGNAEAIVLIDFGLAEGNATAESKGVDLYVLERAILSTHVEAEGFFGSIMKGYELFNKKQYGAVNAKLKEIEKRGRKREMLG